MPQTPTSSSPDSANNEPPIVTEGDPFNGLSFSAGVAENKNSNYRPKMEDVHTYIANFAERLDWGYFAVFDGHAGKSTARWCGNNLHALLEEEIIEREAGSQSSDACPSNLYDLREVLHDVFQKADEIIDKDGAGSSGSTAAVAVLRWESDAPEAEKSESKDSKPEVKAEPKEPESKDSDTKTFDFVPSKHHKRMLYTANVGDSRVVLCRNGKSYRLSYEHKATDPHEVQRVRDEGGLVVKNRVNGVFAITRSLGDSYIKHLVTGKPFTTATEILPEDEFLILACDGVWDVISDQYACKFVREVFKYQKDNGVPYDTEVAAKKLCELAINKATTDNVTVMVVKLDSNVFVSH